MGHTLSTQIPSEKALGKQPITGSVDEKADSSHEPLKDAPTDAQSGRLEDSNNLQSLQYSRLQVPYIRLVTVERERLDGMLQCTLHEAALGPELHFHALSYVWGDSSERQTILVNGQYLEVTQNLYDFLDTACTNEVDLQMRHQTPNHNLPLDDSDKDGETSNRVVAAPLNWWIDAICINQGDIAEKNEQVPRMGDIYSMATRVWIWLGVPHNVFESDSRFWELKHALAISAREADYTFSTPLVEQFEHHRRGDPADRMAALVQIFSMSKLSEPEMGQIVVSLGPDLPLDEISPFLNFLRHFTSVLSHEYFKRTWIIQEYILNPEEPLTLLGNFTFHISDLVKLMLRLMWEGQQMGEKFHAMLAGIMTHFSNMKMLADARGEWHNAASEPDTFSKLQPGHKLLYLLCQFDMRRSSVPHDYFYGLLGLLDQQTLPVSLSPDYNLSFEQVSEQYTKYIIESTGDLRIVESHGTGPGWNTHAVYPSWVPDIRFRFGMHDPDTIASAAIHSFSADDQALAVEGVRIGSILSCSCTACPTQFTDLHLQFIQDVLLQGSARITGESMEVVFARWLRTMLQTAPMSLLPRSYLSTFKSMQDIIEKYKDVCSDMPKEVLEFLSIMGMADMHKLYSTPCRDPEFLHWFLQLSKLRYCLLDTGEILICVLRDAVKGAVHGSDDCVWAVKGFEKVAILRPAEGGYKYCGQCLDPRDMIADEYKDEYKEQQLTYEAGYRLDDDFFESKDVQLVTLV
ncbi:hypothetical protein N0V90_011180 [Kalmusia sp. IMI 367209]|nr:hypothetical protein N0V90_011180 [Kalmusia sp. IMI 367209]